MLDRRLRRFVWAIAGSLAIAALAVTEPGGGSDVAELRTRAVADAMPEFPASPSAISFDICGSSNRAHQRAKSFCGDATGNPALLIHAFGGSVPSRGLLPAQPTTTHEKNNNATCVEFRQQTSRRFTAACRFRKFGKDGKTVF